jgi:hypothetical protein
LENASFFYSLASTDTQIIWRVSAFLTVLQARISKLVGEFQLLSALQVQIDKFVGEYQLHANMDKKSLRELQLF